MIEEKYKILYKTNDLFSLKTVEETLLANGFERFITIPTPLYLFSVGGIGKSSQMYKIMVTRKDFKFAHEIVKNSRPLHLHIAGVSKKWCVRFKILLFLFVSFLVAILLSV